MSTVTKEVTSFGVPWEEEYGYVQGVKAGNLIYLAGQVGHDEAGEVAGDMEEQMRRSYRNVERVLARFGATLDNLVEETLYVVDVAAAWPARIKMKDEIFGGEPQIASTIVEIPRLAVPDFLIEIRTVAVLG